MRLHHNWLGPDVPPLPLTVASITGVVAQLKEGKYLSAADCASAAKGRHMQRYEWCGMLERCKKASVRSARRGLGPAAQCGELLLADVVIAFTAIQGTLVMLNASGCVVEAMSSSCGRSSFPPCCVRG